MPTDKASYGLQRSRQALSGRRLGGSNNRNRLQTAATRRQAFTGRVASLGNRTTTPKPAGKRPQAKKIAALRTAFAAKQKLRPNIKQQAAESLKATKRRLGV